MEIVGLVISLSAGLLLGVFWGVWIIYCAKTVGAIAASKAKAWFWIALAVGGAIGVAAGWYFWFMLIN